jgi:hypothetical protein
VAAITLVLGTGDFTLKFGEFALGGIGTATFGAILLYALLNRFHGVVLPPHLPAGPRARAVSPADHAHRHPQACRMT